MPCLALRSSKPALTWLIGSCRSRCAQASADPTDERCRIRPSEGSPGRRIKQTDKNEVQPAQSARSTEEPKHRER